MPLNIRKRAKPAAPPASVDVLTASPVASLGHNSRVAPDLRIELVPIEQPKLPKRQTRRHSEKQIAELEAGMRRFGIMTALVVGPDMQIVAGVARYLAMKRMGIANVPVIKVEHLTDQELRAYALADNKLAEKAEWAIPELKLELKDLLVSDQFPIELTGFETVEIDGIMLDGGAQEKADEDPLPEPGPAVARLGDTFRCGCHVLLCGDAEKPESYVVLLGDERVRMVFSDNPYNVAVPGNVSGKGKKKHGNFVMASGEMSRERFTEFLTNVFGHCVGVSLDGAIHFQWIDHRHLREMMDAGEAVYSELKNMVVWDKQAGGLGSFYRAAYELAFVWKVGKARHVNNFGLGETGRFRTNLWRYPGAAVQRKGRLDDLALHPTVKNLTMVSDAIRDVSHRGDIVLDPFCGSGTTMIAAERTGRVARCLELDPKYVDVAVRRWEKLTGEKAIHLESGLDFDSLAEQRLSDAATIAIGSEDEE